MNTPNFEYFSYNQKRIKNRTFTPFFIKQIEDLENKIVKDSLFSLEFAKKGKINSALQYSNKTLAEFKELSQLYLNSAGFMPEREKLLYNLMRSVALNPNVELKVPFILNSSTSFSLDETSLIKNDSFEMLTPDESLVADIKRMLNIVKEMSSHPFFSSSFESDYKMLDLMQTIFSVGDKMFKDKF